MGMSPQEFLSAGGGAAGGTYDPEDPKMLLGVDPKRDAPMARTLRNINNGVPAAPMHWQGQPIESGTGAVREEVITPKGMSPEEFIGKTPKESSEASQPLELLKKTGTNLIGLADMVLSVPGMVLATGADIGTRLNELVDPLARGYTPASRKEQGKKALEASSKIAEPFMNPLHKIMTAFGYGEDYTASDVSQAMGLMAKGIEKGGDWIEKKSNGALTTEDVQSFANATMAGLGAWGTAKGLQTKIDSIGKAKPTDLPGAAKTAAEAKQMRETDYSSPQEFTADLHRAAEGEALSAVDKARNAEQQAYNLMQEGASKKKVEAIRKQNPAVGEALDRMMERRGLAAEGFRDTYQGEVIPADQYIPDFRFDNANRPDAPPIRQIGTPTLRLPAPDAPLLEDLSGRFAAEGAARDAAQAAAEAAGRQPTGRGTLFQQRMPDGRLEPVDTGMKGATPDALRDFGTDLQRAAEKQAAGRGFDMTAEERIAWNKATWAKDQLQGGKADPRLLALLAATGLTAAGFAALDPADREDAKLLGLAAALSPVADGLQSLRSALKSAPYSFKLLERLPQDRHTFTKKQVWEQVARADVPQAEKELVRYTLLQHQGDTITASELVKQLNADTADWTLVPKSTSTYSDYGLDRIGRSTPVSSYYPEGAAAQQTPVYPDTTMYELPFEVGSGNHFGNPKLFGWTRHFIEGGKRHVVEIQSDLVQRLKAKTAANTTEVYQRQIETLREAERVLAAWKPEEAVLRPYDALAGLRETNPVAYAAMRANLADKAQNMGFFEAAQRQIREGNLTEVREPERRRLLAYARDAVIQNWRVSIAEMESKLQQSVAGSRLGPLTADWEARLIREELAQEAKERSGMQESLAEKQKQLQNTSDPQQRAFVEDSIKDLEGMLQNTATVRFATPDTVAKVEGWPRARPAERFLGLQDLRRALEVAPENERAAIQELIDQETGVKPYPFKRPEHQSIYDRYRRVVEPLLRKAGGVDYTDPHGHTWIEVPVRPDHAQPKMFGQSGKADPRLLARMAAVGLGTAIGLWASDKDHKWMGAALGALVGVGAGMGPAKLVSTWKGLWKPDTRIRIDGLTNAWEFAQDKAAKLAWDLQRSVEKLVPDEAGRARITQWLDGNKNVQLQGAELRAATMVRAWFEGMRKSAQAAGVLNTGLDNYVTHLWDWKAGSKQSPILEAFWARMEGRGAGMGTKSPYAKERSFSTLEEGKRAGLTPLTEDISAIIGIYSNSMSRAMANKTLVEGLKQAQQPNGIKLVLPYDKAPHFYENVDGLQGVKVHPDIAPSLQFLYSKAPGSALAVGVEMLNTALKRSAVSFSLFHVKALFDAGLAGTSKPLKFLKDLPAFASGSTDLLKQLRQQGLTPTIELAYKSGLKFGLERGARAMEDVGTDSFYAGLKGVQKGLDSAMEGLGAPIKGLAEFNHKFDTFMWDWVHTGMKLNIFAEKVESLMAASAKRHMADPSIPLLTKEQAGAIAASYTNDLLGGLNWRRLAEASSTKWGRNLALQLYSRSGRWWAQLALFAPDWTLSTTRAMTQAFGKGSGVKGLFNPTTLADLHRQYLARAGAYYFVIGNVLNQALSGHWLWENEDPTSIDMGDGRKLQWSKHTMEPVHWGTRPGQQAINKMGIIPKEALEQTLNVDYLSTKGNMRPMEGSRLEHAAKKMLPISVASSFESGAESGLLGFAGIPIHGRKKSDIAYERVLKRIEKLQRKGE